MAVCNGRAFDATALDLERSRPGRGVSDQVLPTTSWGVLPPGRLRNPGRQSSRRTRHRPQSCRSGPFGSLRGDRVGCRVMLRRCFPTCQRRISFTLPSPFPGHFYPLRTITVASCASRPQFSQSPAAVAAAPFHLHERHVAAAGVDQGGENGVLGRIGSGSSASRSAATGLARSVGCVSRQLHERLAAAGRSLITRADRE
jgi:hypothetical protein